MRTALLPLAVLLAAGCATTARVRGENALAGGDYVTAVAEFQNALAEEPDRLDALQGLGIAQYKTGALADASATLDEVLARAPQSGPALLYRGLAALQGGDDATAEDRLQRFRSVESDLRFGAQLDRALGVLRGRDPVGTELRAYIAASLEDSARAAREVRAARAEAERAYWRDPFPYVVRCFPTRRGGLICL